MNIGSISFALALVFQAISIVVAIVRAVRKRNYALEANVRLVHLGALALNVGGIWLLTQLLAENSRLAYVTEVTNASMSLYQRAMAYWGGPAGSLFIWVWALQLITIFAFTLARKQLNPIAVALMQAVTFFFGLLSFFTANPFTQVWQMPDGSIIASLLRPAGALPATLLQSTGLNPLFRHTAMVVHPPLIFLGLSVFMVPAMITAGQRIRGQLMDKEYLLRLQTWNMAGWLLLWGGLLAGSWWSSHASNFGRYWSWDPVQLSTLLPWLSATAQMHTNISRRKRDRLTGLDSWHMFLTWILALFAIYVARSPLYNSRHYFSETDISLPLLGLLLFTLIGSIGITIWRWKKMARPTHQPFTLNRDILTWAVSAIMNLLIVLGVLAIILPHLTNIRQPFENEVFVQIFVHGLLLFALLLGVCPVLSYGYKRLHKYLILGSIALGVVCGTLVWATNGRPSFIALFLMVVVFVGLAAWLITWLSHRYFRSWRRTAGAGIHVGILLLVLGITGVEQFGTTIEQQLNPGQSITWGSYRLDNPIKPVVFSYPSYVSRYTTLQLYRDGHHVASLEPSLDVYPTLTRSISTADAYNTLSRTIQVRLRTADVVTGTITLQIQDKPLENYIWIGGILLLFSGLMMGIRRYNRLANLPGDPPGYLKTTAADKKF